MILPNKDGLTVRNINNSKADVFFASFFVYSSRGEARSAERSEFIISSRVGPSELQSRSFPCISPMVSAMTSYSS